MARSSKNNAKTRIRKSAPTVRERADAARLKNEKAESGKKRRVGSVFAWPFKKLRLGDRKFARIIRKIFNPLKRVLKWLVPNYFVNSWREVRQVTWPNRKETWRLTAAVFIFAIVFGALVAVVDKGLDEIFKKVVLK